MYLIIQIAIIGAFPSILIDRMFNWKDRTFFSAISSAQGIFMVQEEIRTHH